MVVQQKDICTFAGMSVISLRKTLLDLALDLVQKCARPLKQHRSIVTRATDMVLL